MDLTHLHLMTTHLPIFGTILGAGVLLYGLRVKSNNTLIAAYLIFLVSAIGAGVAYLTGEAAEETVEHLAGIATGTIEDHEEFAVNALIASIALGVLSLGGWFFALRKSVVSRVIAAVIFVGALVTFGLAAWTGYLGGQIRHTEVSSAAMQYDQGEDLRQVDEDDD